MIAVKEIKLNRAEGPIEECEGGCKVFKSFADVNDHIDRNAGTYPKMGYDKHDFVIEWVDGYQYQGRLDLMHHENPRFGSEPSNLNIHVRLFVESLVDDTDVSEEDQQDAITFLNSYALCDTEENEKRWVWGNRKDKWYLVSSSDRDFDYGISQTRMANIGKEAAKEIYLNS